MPILFLCENNGLAVHTRRETRGIASFRICNCLSRSGLFVRVQLLPEKLLSAVGMLVVQKRLQLPGVSAVNTWA